MDTAPVQTITVHAPPAHHRAAWRTFLSELNPLQYLPVVGTIYRAVTGDTIPEAVREAGSMVVSGLTGGPIGLAIGLGSLLAEQALGIDPEKIGAHLLGEIGIGKTTPVAAPVAEPVKPQSGVSAAPGWSAAQLASYGVRRGAGGELQWGRERGADVLNSLELRRLQATA